MNVPKICIPTKLSTYILKLSFNVVNISNKLLTNSKYMNMKQTANSFDLKSIW